jgi:hypothetical protein
MTTQLLSDKPSLHIAMATYTLFANDCAGSTFAKSLSSIL